MNIRHPIGVLYTFSIKNIFDNKIESKLFYFHVTKCVAACIVMHFYSYFGMHC